MTAPSPARRALPRLAAPSARWGRSPGLGAARPRLPFAQRARRHWLARGKSRLGLRAPGGARHRCRAGTRLPPAPPFRRPPCGPSALPRGKKKKRRPTCAPQTGEPNGDPPRLGFPSRGCCFSSALCKSPGNPRGPRGKRARNPSGAPMPFLPTSRNSREGNPATLKSRLLAARLHLLRGSSFARRPRPEFNRGFIPCNRFQGSLQGVQPPD